MAFDPNAATATYIDSLGAAALDKAHAYTVGGHWLLLWGLVIAAIVTWLIVRSGVLDKLDAKLGERRWVLRAFVVSGVYFLVWAVLSAPWSIYSGWWRERDYGRTTQPLGDFLGQASLMTVLSALISAIFMIGLYALIRRTGRTWWIWSGGLTALTLAFLFLVSPVVIEPMFNKYEPVPPGPVRNALVEMAAKAHIPADRIFMFLSLIHI